MIIYTGGTFDLFHAGHAEFLEKLHNLSEEVVVGLNPDDFVEKFKGRRPVNSYEERKYVLESCRYVSRVVENSGWQDSKVAILSVGPHIVAIGSDWFNKDYLSQMNFDWRWLHQQNISLMYIPRITPVSSTAIKGRVSDLRNPPMPSGEIRRSGSASDLYRTSSYRYPFSSGYDPSDPYPLD